MTNATTLTVGDVVKFKQPFPDEAGSTYILVEDPGQSPRVDIVPVNLAKWPIPPRQRVNVADLEKAGPTS